MVALSAEALAVLRAIDAEGDNGERIVRKAEITTAVDYDGGAGTPTWTDITQYVVMWGKYPRKSSLSELGEIAPPTARLVLDNVAGYFLREYSESIWTALSAEPEACVLRVTAWVRTSPTATEKFLEFIGRIDSPKINEDPAKVELAATWEGWQAINRPCKKEHGSYTTVNSWVTTPPNPLPSITFTTHNKAGNIFRAPEWTVAPTLRGAGGAGGYQYDHWYMSLKYVVGAILAVWAWDGVTGGASVQPDEEVAMHTWFGSHALIDDSAGHEFRMETVGAVYSPLGGTFPKLYNPLAWKDETPARIMHDLLIYGAELSTFLMVASDFTTADAFQAALTPARTMRCILYGKNYTEHLLEVADYAPDWLLAFDAFSRMRMKVVRNLAVAAPSIEIAERNFKALLEDDVTEDRLATNIDAQYNAYVDNGNFGSGVAGDNVIWQLDRDVQTGGKRGHYLSAEGEKIYRRHADSPSIGTLTRFKDLVIQLPWFSGEVADHWARITEWMEVYDNIFKTPHRVTNVLTGAEHLPVEAGDVAIATIAGLKMVDKKYMVLGVTPDLDNLTTEIDLRRISNQ